MSRPLRLLMMVHTRWSRNLGASRVPMELAEELRELGDEVATFSYDDAFPDPAGPRGPGALVTLAGYLRSNRSFARRAAAFVRKSASCFDVIDANQTDLPFPKQALGFRGLLVARSVGLIPAYESFEREARRLWPEPRSLRGAVEGLLTLPGRRRRLPDAWLSFRHADLINVSNSDDYAALQAVHGAKVAYFPLGLSSARLACFQAARAAVAERLAARAVAFIGTWNARKGARDWPRIWERLCRLVPEARLLLLGTGLPEHRVRADFPAGARLEVVPAYENEALPRLLARATVGAFPGHLEGFGFGVLEKLAASLPTVAYDAPGSRDILRRHATSALVPRGDCEAFARRLAELLTLPAGRYAQEAAESARVAATFAWREIALRTRETYLERFASLERR